MASPEFRPTVPELIRTLAARHGERELIVQDDRRITYAEAEEASAKLGLALQGRGVGKSSRVGVLFPNGVDWVVAWLAATRVGAVMVPINTFYQARELAWTLRHADVGVLLACDRFLSHDYLARLEEAVPGLAEASGAPLRLASHPFLREVVVWGEGERAWATPRAALAAERDDAFLRAVEAEVAPADPMCMLYSSGSTADPKGAVHSHGAVVRHSYNLYSLRDLKADDRIYTPMPFFWVGGFVFTLVGNLHAGACNLCEEVFEPEKTLRFLERERATIAMGWPHFGKALAEHPSRAERDLSSIRAGNLPGIVPDDVFPPDPGLRPNALGMTETCGPHTWGGSGELPEDQRGSFGPAVPGVEHKVIDPETGATLGPGESGEICVRGYSLMQGLHKLEREEVFDADGFYRTGDAGWFDERGILYFQARLGEMIKSAGANVTPSEVEAVLLERPEVKEAYVVGLADPERGQLVTAAIVFEPGQRLDEDALRVHAKGRLAAYKVPRRFHVAEPGTLPFTDSGKIDKKRLQELLAGS